MDTQTLERPAPAARGATLYRPLVDILDREQEVVVLADVPGSNPADIDVQYEDGTLTVHARVEQRQPAGHAFLLQEYGHGDWRRSFRVGEGLDAQGISASYADGVLTLRLPRTEAARPRRIEVRPA